MSLLSPPNTKYSDYYDQARFKLVWNMLLLFTGFIFILTAINYTNDNYKPEPYLAAFFLSLISIIVLKYLRRYEVMSYVISIGGFLITSYTFLAHENVIQYTPPMWVVIDVIFTFFTLGRKWGWGILILHFVVLCIFFYTKFQSNLAGLPVYDDLDVHYFVLEFGFASVFMGYILHMFVTTTYYAERKFKVSNTRLNNKNTMISKQNEEKEVMLKEIHHRVKNNLQVITSLLRLQSYEIEGEDNLMKFNEAISRIKAMALIHEKMYQKEMLENFDLDNYIRSLASDLVDTYAVDKKVSFKVEASIERVGSKTIVPLALLFNELITNSLKHAFHQIEEPSITIMLFETSNGFFEMNYADNGRWRENEDNTFGEELIATMTEQLDGSCELTKGFQGTQYRFQLKNLNEQFDEKMN